MGLMNDGDALIVFGSFAPGGTDHHLIAHLPGEFTPGKVNAKPGATNVEWRFDPYGEDSPADAWRIIFSDRHLGTALGEEFDQWDQIRFDRWEELEEIFGTSFRWVPIPFNADSETTAGRAFVSKTQNPQETNRDDEVNPRDRYNSRKLWQQLLDGEKNYDESVFYGFIGSIPPAEYKEYFCQLPNSAGFIDRLHRLTDDHTPAGRSSPYDTGSEETSYWYITPTADNAESNPDTRIAIAKAHILMMLNYLERAKPEVVAETATQLRSLHYQIVDPVEETPPSDIALSEAFYHADFEPIDNPRLERWWYHLSEACYSISCDYDMQRWLMQDWIEDCPNYEPWYQAFVTGTEFWIEKGVCYVYGNPGR